MHIQKSLIQMLNILVSVYLSSVKYPMLLISDIVVIVVHLLFIFNIKI